MIRATLPVTSRVGEPEPCATGVPSAARRSTLVLEIVAGAMAAEKVIVGWTVTGTDGAPLEGRGRTAVGPVAVAVGTVTSRTPSAEARVAKVRSELVTSSDAAPRAASAAIVICARTWLHETTVVETTVILGSEKLTAAPGSKFAPLT